MSDLFDKLNSKISEAVLDSEGAVDAFRVQFLSKKQGKVTELLRQLKSMPPEKRREFGQKVNTIKQLVQARISEATAQLSQKPSTSANDLDLTLPGRKPLRGSLHPITQTLNEIKRIFQSSGFEVAEGPEIEDDWHNFSALNFPPDHPARDMQDTFFLEEPGVKNDGIVLRTHTSPVQIRVMENRQPPVRVIVPGRVYRNEAISYKSYCLFHQVEGLYVDENVTFADLKHLLNSFSKSIFGSDVNVRFRPSYFPFTEPSAEVDIWWSNPELPAGGRWLEILGCGMVDPNVLDAVGIDSERYTGYAFGMGVERIAMLRYDIEDIRILYENDIRFLQQF